MSPNSFHKSQVNWLQQEGKQYKSMCCRNMCHQSFFGWQLGGRTVACSGTGDFTFSALWWKAWPTPTKIIKKKSLQYAGLWPLSNS
ncbi:hypothetical protein GDO86_011942 [Hymenochirus boettgeri]|uniref:Uncharacterized protein n=1 Tax=Hymenochirus boettgeri TaxID=247094 RepID=A0A8T2JII2_9PIPI|nr:hypothetical protein GDO86_011942 [Hymenochirus boettgeri]